MHAPCQRRRPSSRRAPRSSRPSRTPGRRSATTTPSSPKRSSSSAPGQEQGITCATGTPPRCAGSATISGSASTGGAEQGSGRCVRHIAPRSSSRLGPLRNINDTSRRGRCHTRLRRWPTHPGVANHPRPWSDHLPGLRWPVRPSVNQWVRRRADIPCLPDRRRRVRPSSPGSRRHLDAGRTDAGDALTDNLHLLGRPYHAASVLLCTPGPWPKISASGWPLATRSARSAGASCAKALGTPICAEPPSPLQSGLGSAALTITRGERSAAPAAPTLTELSGGPVRTRPRSHPSRLDDAARCPTVPAVWDRRFIWGPQTAVAGAKADQRRLPSGKRASSRTTATPASLLRHGEEVAGARVARWMAQFAHRSGLDLADALA